jgi:branched-chain amino acid transport system permease protein
VRIIDPDIFLFIYTVTMVIMVITGGKGTLAGPIVGGVIFGLLPVALRAWATPVAQWIIYGVLMILIVFFLPRGIVPAMLDWWTNITVRTNGEGEGRDESVSQPGARNEIAPSPRSSQ